MLSIIIYLFMICLFVVAPLPVQFVMLIINTFAPDPIPYLDEVIMYLSFLKNLATLGRILEFIEEHSIISALIGIAIVVLVIIILF